MGVAVLLLLFAAQTPQTAYSIEFGGLTAFDDATVQFGFRAAPSVAGKPGADILLATFPDALTHGVLLFVLDADAAYGARLTDQLTLFPRFGGSIIAGGGQDAGAGAAWGYNLGAGLLMRASPTLGARIDYTRYGFVGGGGTLPASSITIGFVWMH